MPLQIKDYEWSETEVAVTVKVPLKGVSVKNVDIFSTDAYLKVHFPPYLFEVPLCSEINDELSKATISNGMVTFQLHKKEPGIWYQLFHSKHEEKDFMTQLRKEAVEFKQKQEQKKMQNVKEEKERLKKMAVREQMKLEEEERERLKVQKEMQHTQTSKEIQDWKEKVHYIPSKSEKIDDCYGTETIISKQDNSRKIENPKANDHPKKTRKKQSIPKPRATGTIEISFTPRQLATPARESKQPEEELWLEKLAAMNKVKEDIKKDFADVEELNPIWLKDKGNSFYKSGNFLAAINAYTSGLMLDSKVPMLYANRAACHLHLKQYSECIQDCTMALELYDPPCQANLISRCRAFTRRGTALYYLEQFVDALHDYESAIKLDPKNDELRTDAYRIRRTIQGADSED